MQPDLRACATRCGLIIVSILKYCKGHFEQFFANRYSGTIAKSYSSRDAQACATARIAALSMPVDRTIAALACDYRAYSILEIYNHA